MSVQQLSYEPSSNAVEVAAMLGDSVVDVKHCMDPQGGRVRRGTWAALAFGVTLLGSAAIAFAISVHTAAVNNAALDHWTHVLHKPAFAFRAEQLSVGYDVITFGGLAFGLAAIGLFLARRRVERRSPFYRIGTAPGVEAAIEGAPTASFPLVAPSGDGFVFNYATGIDGELVVDGASTSLAELVARGHARPSMVTAGAVELPIPARGKIRARAGKTTFLVSAVAQPARMVTPLLASLESRTTAYFAGSLVAHLAVWGLLQMIPIEDSAGAVDLAMSEETGMKATSAEREAVPPERKVEVGDADGGQSNPGAKMELEEGASGKLNAAKTDGHMAIKNNDVPPQLARQQAIEEARYAGVLGSASQMGAAFASLTSTDAISSGFDTTNAYGAMYGAYAGENAGNFGYGRSGFGAGGGCTMPPCGLVGPGNYGTIGNGTHAGDGWGGPGNGHDGGLRKHVSPVIDANISNARIVGDLDKSIIKRYIKQNIEKISFCYQHELIAHPGIGGEVLAQFFISPMGTVQASTAQGFDGTVSSCVAGVIANIEFPRPHGGGGVQVNYPFTFHQAGT